MTTPVPAAPRTGIPAPRPPAPGESPVSAGRTHYCSGCGRWDLLDQVTLWCRRCQDQWLDSRRAPALSPAAAP
jgi:hypothetical protein